MTSRRAGSLRGLLIALSTGWLSGCAAPDYQDPFPGTPTVEIDWEPWGSAAFEKAAREDKLILISVHATWCHWCHVMDERTFADPVVARLVRRHFVAVKANADAHPDVAERYRRWGWPATAILTPDARPVLERRGFVRPGPFAELLRGVVRRRGAGEDVARRDRSPESPAVVPSTPALARGQARLDTFYDVRKQGWGLGKQKYPWGAPVEHSLLRAWLRPKHKIWRERALATLEQELKLMDPVWGGLYQYSDDGSWTSPHYEKVASVQAGALSNFAQAYRFTGDARWLRAALDVYRYLVQFWRDERGAFACSQDADPPAAASVPGGPNSGKAYFALDDAKRRARGLPRVDRSVYANTNGLLIRALCELFRASGESAHRDDAVRAADALRATHVREVELAIPIPGVAPRDSHWAIRHAAGEGQTVHLDDQVNAGAAFLAVFGVTGEQRWLDAAQATARGLIVELEDLDGGGFYARSADARAVGVFAKRRKPFVENARAARFLCELSAITTQPGWRASAARALKVLDVPGRVKAQGRILGEYLLALERLASHPVTLTVVGRGDDASTQALLLAAQRFPLPGALVKRVEPGDGFPDRGRGTLYMCTENTCSPPLDDPTALGASVREFLGRDPRPISEGGQ